MDLCRKCGEVDDVKIFYDPKNNRHLGLAFAAFKKIRGARKCMERYNRATVMGKTIEVRLDSFGKKLRSFFYDS